jgi:hypothetical protein
MASPDDATGDGRRFARAPLTVWRRSGDQAVVLCPDRDDPLLLSGTGRIIWELLDEPMTAGELASFFGKAPGGEYLDVWQGVRAFLAELEAEGAVETRPDLDVDAPALSP